MVSRLVRFRWANKLLNAKGFVVMTDKESIIALKGMEPRLLKDELALQEQVLSIEDFIVRLKALQKEHIAVIEELRTKAKTKVSPKRYPDKYEEIPLRKEKDNGRK